MYKPPSRTLGDLYYFIESKGTLGYPKESYEALICPVKKYKKLLKIPCLGHGLAPATKYLDFASKKN